jgi:hypothetical protein
LDHFCVRKGESHLSDFRGRFERRSATARVGVAQIFSRKLCVTESPYTLQIKKHLVM